MGLTSGLGGFLKPDSSELMYVDREQLLRGPEAKTGVAINTFYASLEIRRADEQKDGNEESTKKEPGMWLLDFCKKKMFCFLLHFVLCAWIEIFPLEGCSQAITFE